MLERSADVRELNPNPPPNPEPEPDPCHILARRGEGTGAAVGGVITSGAGKSAGAATRLRPVQLAVMGSHA